MGTGVVVERDGSDPLDVNVVCVCEGEISSRWDAGREEGDKWLREGSVY